MCGLIELFLNTCSTPFWTLLLCHHVKTQVVQDSSVCCSWPDKSTGKRALCRRFVLFTKRALRAHTQGWIHAREHGKQLSQLWCMNPLNPTEVFSECRWKAIGDSGHIVHMHFLPHSTLKKNYKNKTKEKKERAHTGLSCLPNAQSFPHSQQHNRKQSHRHYWRIQAN